MYLSIILSRLSNNEFLHKQEERIYADSEMTYFSDCSMNNLIFIFKYL